LLIECEVVHLGKRMGMLKGVMRRKDNGAVCCTCEHQKAVAEFTPKYNL
jgi:acyl-coenzyme A thioesterase 13